MKTGRPCKKSYEPKTVMEELLSTVDAVFEEKQEIKATATELDLAELKVRKLLITSGKLHYPISREKYGSSSKDSICSNVTPGKLEYVNI